MSLVSVDVTEKQKIAKKLCGAKWGQLITLGLAYFSGLKEKNARIAELEGKVEKISKLLNYYCKRVEAMEQNQLKEDTQSSNS